MSTMQHIPSDQSTSVERAAAVKQIVVGSIIMEYGAQRLSGKHDLKNRVQILKNAAQSVQSYLLNNPGNTAELRAIFEREFLKNEIVLLSELFETVWGIKEEALEIIINTIKENVV